MIKDNRAARLILWAVVLSIFLLPGALMADDFSADMVSATREGRMRGKIFFGKDRFRVEMPGSVTITRMDKKVVWLIMPQDKMYMEQPFVAGGGMAAATDKVNGEIERKALGEEMLDGKMAAKYKVVYKQGKDTITVFQWFIRGIKIPVKTEALDASWSVEYRNIKVGRQPDDIFEVPAGYQRFTPKMPSFKDMLKGAADINF